MIIIIIIKQYITLIINTMNLTKFPDKPSLSYSMRLLGNEKNAKIRNYLRAKALNIPKLIPYGTKNR